MGEYYRTFFNNNDFYTLTIELRDEADAVIAAYSTGNLTITNSDWTWAGTTFSDYEAGVRKVYIRDGGKDSEFWAGHYGTRSTGLRSASPWIPGQPAVAMVNAYQPTTVMEPVSAMPVSRAACAIGEAVSYCGDGTVDEGEACDDGEANNDAYGSDCNLSCSGPAAYCGDGILDRKRPATKAQITTIPMAQSATLRAAAQQATAAMVSSMRLKSVTMVTTTRWTIALRIVRKRASASQDWSNPTTFAWRVRRGRYTGRQRLRRARLARWLDDHRRRRQWLDLQQRQQRGRHPRRIRNLV